MIYHATQADLTCDISPVLARGCICELGGDISPARVLSIRSTIAGYISSFVNLPVIYHNFSDSFSKPSTGKVYCSIPLTSG